MRWTPRTLDSGFKSGRERLQARYAEVARLPDASRLAYLRGQEHVVTEEQIRDLWAKALENPVLDAETSNNIYIHVPFCKSICNFCNYERLRPSNPGLLRAWLNRIIHSMKTIGPAVDGVQWGSVYIGGGTPSTLPAAMLRELFEAMEEHLEIHPEAHRSFEFDPLVMSSGRVAALADHGFTHFSFGIQTLDPEVNKAHNRGFQDRNTVTKRFEELYSHGLYDVACDFLLGLAGTTPETILADIEWVLETHKPQNADVFQIAPTPEYVDLHFGGDLDAFWAHLEPFQRDAIPELKSIAKRQGYSVNVEGGHRYTLRRSHLPKGFEMPPSPVYSYNQLVSEAGRPMHLLGFGPSARSQIFGYAAYQGRSPADPEGDAPFHYAGHLIDLDDEVRTFLVHQLRDNNHVDRDRFKRIFGRDVTEAIPVPMSAWAEAGIVKVATDKVHLADATRRERMSNLLWLVPERHIEHEIARRQQLDLGREGVLRLLGELMDGQVLFGNHTFGGITESGRIVILTPQRQNMRFRVAPGLEDGAPLRLVLESPPPRDAQERKDLIRAMAQVRGVMRASQAAYH